MCVLGGWREDWEGGEGGEGGEGNGTKAGVTH